MNTFSKSLLAAAILSTSASFANAAIRITEVAPWGSSGSNPAIPYGTDWFELTNTGTSDVSIAGWKMDDDSNGSAKVNLVGITTIKAHESVIFMETNNKASFLSTWFGTTPPAGLQIGTYTGGGVGLSQSGDAVNIFDASGALQARVTFGASDATSPYQTFDNSRGLDNVNLTALSSVGTYGAFVAKNHSIEIGSPGVVPEPETYAMLLAGLGIIGAVVRKRQA